MLPRDSNGLLRGSAGLTIDASTRESRMSWSILVVDDSATARAQLRVAFEAKGARVVEAENGRDGLWRARSEKVDLIISDVHMPVMDGLQMIQEIRKHPELANTVIFVLTSDAASTRAAEGKKAGANAWIIKPIKPELLWKAVEKALFGRQSGSHAKSTPVADDAVGNVNK
jgi:two-component system, chemotaxis family, chemotaxis protein CheY